MKKTPDDAMVIKGLTAPRLSGCPDRAYPPGLAIRTARGTRASYSPLEIVLTLTRGRLGVNQWR